MTYNEFIKATLNEKADIGYSVSHTQQFAGTDRVQDTLWYESLGSTGNVHYTYRLLGCTLDSWLSDNKLLTCYETHAGKSDYIIIEKESLRSQLMDIYNMYGSIPGLFNDICIFVESNPTADVNSDYISIIHRNDATFPVKLGRGGNPDYTDLHCMFYQDMLHMSLMAMYSDGSREAFNLHCGLLKKVTEKPTNVKDSSYTADIERVLEVMGP